MRRWFSIQAKADDAAEISVFDEIGGWGIHVDQFKGEFDSVKDAKNIKLLVNSPGGNVFDGIAMYNLLSGVRERLDVEVVGLAASAASVVALSGRTLTMGEGSYLMIHNPWALAVGNAADMRAMADTLEKMRGVFADMYESHSALSRDEVLAAMDAETWYTAEEAVDAGLADDVIDYGEVAACAYDLSKFAYAHVPGEMLARAKVSVVPETIRDFERFLRDAGYSKTESKAIASRGFKGRRDAEPEEPATVRQEEPVEAPDYSILLRVEENRRKARSIKR